MPRGVRNVPDPVIDIPPGPIHFEVRINGKIALLQRVHSFSIDQQQDGISVTASLRPAKQPQPAEPDDEVDPEL